MINNNENNNDNDVSWYESYDESFHESLKVVMPFIIFKANNKIFTKGGMRKNVSVLQLQ